MTERKHNEKKLVQNAKPSETLRWRERTPPSRAGRILAGNAPARVTRTHVLHKLYPTAADFTKGSSTLKRASSSARALLLSSSTLAQSLRAPAEHAKISVLDGLRERKRKAQGSLAYLRRKWQRPRFIQYTATSGQSAIAWQPKESIDQ
jgi:hypothetical protein